MKTVSIIVPVYNISEFLPSCIDSLLRQTFFNLQILLVDDGSTDGSAEICDKMALRDTRVQSLHKNWGGLSSARNAGIESATGDYLLFVDGDDWIEPHSVDRLLSVAIRHDADVVAFGVSVDYIQEGYSVKKAIVQEMTEGGAFTRQQMVHALCDSGLMNSVCLKLYSRNYINTKKVFFALGMEPIEDVLFNSQIFDGSCKVVVIPDVLYHYMKRGVDSLVTKYRDNMYEVSELRSKAFREMYARNGLTDEAAECLLQREYLDGKSDCILNCYRTGSTMRGRERTALIRQVIKAEQFKCAKKHSDIRTFPSNILVRLSFLPPGCIRVIYDFLFWMRRHFRGIYSKYRKRIGRKNAG